MSLDKTLYSKIFDDLKSRLSKPELIYNLHSRVQKFDALPSGIAVIDDLLSGGLPEGKIVEIFGPEASGKTTLVLTFIANAQRLGYITLFIDAEHALDVDYASKVGVDMNQLLFSQPEFGEQGLEIVRSMCETLIEQNERTGKQTKSLIVIDSVPACVPKSDFEVFEDEKKDGLESSTSLGTQARMFSKNIPPLLNKVARAKSILVFINQERDNIGVMYGSPTTTPGGRAIKFYSSLRIKVNRIGYATEGENKTGIKTQIVPIKSKQFPIFGRKAIFIIGQKGIDETQSLIDFALEKSILKKGGAWIKYAGGSYQGVAAFAEELNSNPSLKKKLSDEVKQLNSKIELKPSQNQQQAVEQPIIKSPVIEQTVIKNPVIEQTVIKSSAVEQQIVEQLIVEKQIVEQTVVDQQTDKATLPSPVQTTKPITIQQPKIIIGKPK